MTIQIPEVLNSVKIRAEIDSLDKFWEKGDKALYRVKLRLEDTKWGPQYTSVTASNELITRSIKPGAWVQIVAKMGGKEAQNGKFYMDVKAVSIDVIRESPEDSVPSSLEMDEVPF